MHNLTWAKIRIHLLSCSILFLSLVLFTTVTCACRRNNKPPHMTPSSQSNSWKRTVLLHSSLHYSPVLCRWSSHFVSFLLPASIFPNDACTSSSAVFWLFIKTDYIPHMRIFSFTTSFSTPCTFVPIRKLINGQYCCDVIKYLLFTVLVSVGNFMWYFSIWIWITKSDIIST